MVIQELMSTKYFNTIKLSKQFQQIECVVEVVNFEVNKCSYGFLTANVDEIS